MRHFTRGMVAALILILSHAGGAASMDGKPEVTSPGGEEELLGRAVRLGTVRIIVKLRMESGGRVEGSPEKSVAAAQERLLADLAAKGLTPSSVHKYTYSPLLAMTVDRNVLEALLVSPWVETIEADTPVPPARKGE